MKFLIQVFATIILCFILQYFLPWWTMAIGAFGVGYFSKNKGYISFFCGLLSIGLLWLTMAFFIDVTTQSVLSQKVNNLLHVNALLLTGIVGGLVGGFAALTGSVLGNLTTRSR